MVKVITTEGAKEWGQAPEVISKYRTDGGEVSCETCANLSSMGRSEDPQGREITWRQCIIAVNVDALKEQDPRKAAVLCRFYVPRAYKMSKVAYWKDWIVRASRQGAPISADEVEELVLAVRDEEFRLHDLKATCRWDGLPSGENGETPCSRCPCEGTRYCP